MVNYNQVNHEKVKAHKRVHRVFYRPVKIYFPFSSYHNFLKGETPQEQYNIKEDNVALNKSTQKIGKRDISVMVACYDEKTNISSMRTSSNFLK